ncbi:MAG TPA: amylo-alpha-1,6-glucosidase [Dehalococcoidia bacterium]|nr:amylo-alpha-1,6-glucosidase [Dehalococcoidia bacterium]
MRIEDQGFQQALAVLKSNATKEGFRASSEIYNSIWGRDGSVICLGALLTGDDVLIQASRRTLLTLRDLQTPLGQIPNVLFLDSRRVDYYAVDATAWWLIAVNAFWRLTHDERFLRSSKTAIKKAVTWLRYQSLDNTGLINSPPSADWMDCSIQRWGRVFYNNVLYFRALAGLSDFGQEIEPVPGPDGADIARRLNFLFWPERPINREWLPSWDTTFYEQVIEPQREHYLNYLSFETYEDSCDVLANCLAVLWDIADSRKRAKILRYFRRNRLSNPFPIRVLHPPVLQPNMLWNPKIDLSREHYWQNAPYCYHNASVWPWVGGFYVAALAKAGDRSAGRELVRLALANKAGRQGEWEFNEWLHGQTGEPSGAVRQSWSAAGYIIAYKAVLEGILL